MQERTARLSAEADLQSLRAQVTPTVVPPTVDQNAVADSVARAVVAAQSASRAEPLDSRAFSKLDKFWSERTRWHDCAAALQSYISNANADMHTEMTAVEGKTAVTPNVAVINLDSVARSKSVHLMLAMLVEGFALDIILSSGQGAFSGACSTLCDGNSTSFHIGFELVRSFRRIWLRDSVSNQWKFRQLTRTPQRQEALRIAEALGSSRIFKSEVSGYNRPQWMDIDTLPNTADLGTKFLDAARRKQLIGMLPGLSEWCTGGVRRRSHEVDVDVERASRE